MIALAPRASNLPLCRDQLEMTRTEKPKFGSLLRQYRLEAGLSQEALAERAGLSARAIGALEHGERRAPYQATVRSLATALGLPRSEWSALEATVSRSRGPRATGQAESARTPVTVPVPPTPLRGRAEELETARTLLQSEAVRLLTITGPGGVGKTRFALELSRALQSAFPDGVWFIDLASIQDDGLVLSSVAQTLGVSEEGQLSPLAALQAYLADRKLLLVLDTFEQVLAAAPRLAELLATTRSVKILVTSRERLRLRGEQNLRLPPLPLPSEHDRRSIEALAAVPAVALLVDRLRAANPSFELTEANADSIAALCTHLEGLPLAIELAAARASVLTPAEMLAWMDRRLPVLGWDAPDLPSRHQTLRAAIAWSYDLLGRAEQKLFRRLSVFADGWTVEAAEAVTRMHELGLEPVQGLTRLVDASLVEVSQTEQDGSRFRLLGPVQEFAAEQLAASGELEAIQHEHASYYSAIALRAAPEPAGRKQGASGSDPQRDHEYLRAALAWIAHHEAARTEMRRPENTSWFAAPPSAEIRSEAPRQPVATAA